MQGESRKETEMIQNKRSENRIFEVGKHEIDILGAKVEYRLFCEYKDRFQGYEVEIKRGDEMETCYLGEDFLSVAVLYAELVKGEVLPYSLPEIVEDFLADKKIYREKSE